MFVVVQAYNNGAHEAPTVSVLSVNDAYRDALDTAVQAALEQCEEPEAEIRRVLVDGMFDDRGGQWSISIVRVGSASEEGVSEAMTNQEFVNEQGCKCPNCRSTDIEATKGADFQGDWCVLPIGCNECAARWDELYTLHGYDNLEVPESSDD